MQNKAKSRQRAPQTKSLVSVIDDDKSVRESVVGLMDSLGLRSKAFSTAVEFLASAELFASSCIIADVQMPQMTGVELYGRLKTLGHAVPTILMTAYPDENARTRALADGIICYLIKPFDKDDLIGCVRTALQSRYA